MERKRLFRSHMERTRPVSLSLPCKKNVEDENPLRTKESSTRKDEMEVRRKREKISSNVRHLENTQQWATETLREIGVCCCLRCLD